MKSLGITLAILSAVAVLSCPPWDAPAAAASDPVFEIYGFAKADVIYDVKRMDAAWSSVMRPSQILVPNEDTPYYDEGEIIYSLRASRLGTNFNLPTAGRPLTGKFEIDFFGTGNNAGQQLPRLRQIYISYGALLVGQTWSLFNDTDIWPITLDFWGPCGLLASRRPQLRWTALDTDTRSLAFALEQPGAGIDAGKGPQFDPELHVNPRSVLPDFTAQFKVRGDRGYVQLAAVVRQLGYEGTITLEGVPTNYSDAVAGWGGYLSGRWKTSDRSGLLASVVYGEGISNYGNDGGVDVAPDEELLATALSWLGWHLAYDAFWNPRWSTSLGASQTIQDNSVGQNEDAFNTGTYTFINLVYYPEANLSYGMEFLWGELTLKDGSNNDDYRLQFSAKYGF